MRLRSTELLSALMKSHEVSHRELSTIAGYATHTHLGLALRGDPKHQGFRPEAAMRIASYLGVDLHVLFEPCVSTSDGRTGEQIRKERRKATVPPAPLPRRRGRAA